MKTLILVIIITFLLLPICAFGGVSAIDTPNDDGESITIIWNPDSIPSNNLKLTRVKIERRTSSESGWEEIGVAPFSQRTFIDDAADDGIDYVYRLLFTGENGKALIYRTEAVHSSAQIFNTKRINVLIGIIICIFVLLYYIYRSQKGRQFYVRPIPGLQAVEEAVGRATELGKPVLYSAGRGNMQRVATIASMTVLSSVAEKTAEYNIPLIFPNNDAVVTAVAQEVVYDAYAKTGHPDRYKEDDIFYLTDSQFGYAAAVDGIMLRRKPATNLFMGTFEAESLILAETGNSIGAIQIAGTDSTIQLSFFIVACDYVLIGEEYFAASGYLSQDPMILGSLKGQDMLKVVVGVLILLGALAVTFGFTGFLDIFSIG